MSLVAGEEGPTELVSFVLAGGVDAEPKGAGALPPTGDMGGVGVSMGASSLSAPEEDCEG